MEHENFRDKIENTSEIHLTYYSFISVPVGDEISERNCCNACEKPRDTHHTIYLCLECGSCFVSHFDCFFSENDLSIAHKLGNKTSILLIINPALTVNEFLESIAMYETAELDATAGAARSEEVAVGQVLQQEESDCSAQKVPIYSHEEFIISMEKYKSTSRDTRSELKRLETNSQVANVDLLPVPMLSFFTELFSYNPH